MTREQWLNREVKRNTSSIKQLQEGINYFLENKHLIQPITEYATDNGEPINNITLLNYILQVKKEQIKIPA